MPAFSARADARSVPNGFSTTSRRHMPFSFSMPVRAELAADRQECVRRRREIEQPYFLSVPPEILELVELLAHGVDAEGA